MQNSNQIFSPLATTTTSVVEGLLAYAQQHVARFLRPIKDLLGTSVRTSWRLAKLALIIWIVKRARDICLALRKPDRAIEFAEGRFARLVFAWLTGRTLRRTTFNPLEPAGDDRKRTWTTIPMGLETTTEAGTKISQPLRCQNGSVRFWFTRWTQETERSGQSTTITLTPRWLPGSGDSRALSIASREEDVDGDFAMRTERTGKETVTYVARTGMHASARLSARTEAAVRAALENNGAKTQAFSIGTVIKAIDKTAAGPQDADLQLAAFILADYWAKKWGNNSPQTTRPPQALQRLEDSRQDDLAPFKATGTRIGPDFCLHPDAAPVTGRSNDLVAIEARLDSVRNPNLPIPPDILKSVDDFVDEVVSGKTGMTFSLEHVLASQDGPLQRVRNEMARAWVLCKNTGFKVKAFLKKEAIVNSGPTRNISTLPAETNLQYGTVTLSISNFLKNNTKWYCPSNAPATTARRMVECLDGQRRITAADFSKMDARKSARLAARLIHQLCVRLLPDQADLILQLHEAEMTCTARTDGGEPYCSAISQLSGSASTTLHNTLANAFMCYAAHRREGMDHKSAYENTNLALFVGDDSVSRNTMETIEGVGKDLGYEIVAEVIPYGAEVPFLSRWFPAAWFGEQGSYQDPARLMRKISMSFGDPSRGTQQLAADKWRGMAELDPAMTLFTVGYSVIRRITNKTGDLLSVDTPWYLRQNAGHGGWPQLENADNYFEMRTGLPPSVLVSWFLSVTDWEDFLAGPPHRIQNVVTIKRPTVDPFSPMTPPPTTTPAELPPPPEHATATDHPVCVAKRKEVEKLSKELAKDLSKVSRAVRRKNRQERRAESEPDIFTGMGSFDTRSATSAPPFSSQDVG